MHEGHLVIKLSPSKPCRVAGYSPNYPMGTKSFGLSFGDGQDKDE